MGVEWRVEDTRAGSVAAILGVAEDGLGRSRKSTWRVERFRRDILHPVQIPRASRICTSYHALQ